MTRVSFASENDILARSQQESFPYFVTLCGKEFIVLANVFSPKYFPDVDMFARHLPVRKGDKVLEIGSGIGFVAIDAITRGADRVVATDINPFAVRNIHENACYHGVLDRIDIRQGSVFAPIERDEKFDIIYWNAPFQYIEEDMPSSMLQQSICDIAYRGIQEYITSGRHYLSESGRLFLGFSSSIGSLDKLNEILQKLETATLHWEAKEQVTRGNDLIFYELLEVVYTAEPRSK